MRPQMQGGGTLYHAPLIAGGMNHRLAFPEHTGGGIPPLARFVRPVNMAPTMDNKFFKQPSYPDSQRYAQQSHPCAAQQESWRENG